MKASRNWARKARKALTFLATLYPTAVRSANRTAFEARALVQPFARFLGCHRRRHSPRPAALIALLFLPVDAARHHLNVTIVSNRAARCHKAGRYVGRNFSLNLFLEPLDLELKARDYLPTFVGTLIVHKNNFVLAASKERADTSR